MARAESLFCPVYKKANSRVEDALTLRELFSKGALLTLRESNLIGHSQTSLNLGSSRSSENSRISRVRDKQLTEKAGKQVCTICNK